MAFAPVWALRENFTFEFITVKVKVTHTGEDLVGQ